MAFMSMRLRSLPLLDTSSKIATSFLRFSTKGLTKPSAWKMGKWFRREEFALLFAVSSSPNLIQLIAGCHILTVRSLAHLLAGVRSNMCRAVLLQPSLFVSQPSSNRLSDSTSYPSRPWLLSMRDWPHLGCQYLPQVRSLEGVGERRRPSNIFARVSSNYCKLGERY